MSDLWPGDIVRGEDGARWKIGALLAYRGGEGCTNPRCTRRGVGSSDMGECVGWHCSRCDAPCSSQGHHDCPRADQ